MASRYLMMRVDPIRGDVIDDAPVEQVHTREEAEQLAREYCDREAKNGREAEAWVVTVPGWYVVYESRAIKAGGGREWPVCVN